MDESITYRVEITQRALWDAEAVFVWMNQQRLPGAQQWLDSLYAVIDTLETFPTRCPLTPENRATDREFRQLLYGKRSNQYRIIFEIRGDVVVVTRIRHTAQAPLTADELEPFPEE